MVAGPTEIASSARPLDRGVARRQAFLEAAREVFLDQGYEAASVNDVVRLAGGSLATLYSQFGNKEGLFLAVVQDQHDRVLASMAPSNVDDLSLEDGLYRIGEQFVRAILAKDGLAFFRITIGEGRKFPELVQRYISVGADRVREVVVSHLRKAAPEFKGDHDMTASYFLELLRGRHHYRALSDADYKMSDEQIAEHVASATKFFICGMCLKRQA